MRHLLSALISAALLAGAILAPASARAEQSISVAEASGLIIGFKGDEADDPPSDKPHGPWASGRDGAKARWDKKAREGRERLSRVAKEAGLPEGTIGEAGNGRLLRFNQPLRGKALDNALRRARLHPDVAWVEPNVLVPRLGVPRVPNDALFNQQWHLQSPTAPGNPTGLNLPPAWGDTIGSLSGSTAVVAVVDSGIRPGHPDLAGKLLPGYDLVSELSVANDGNGRDNDPTDPGDWIDSTDRANPLFASCDLSGSSWHGTFIAGQLAAATDNGQGVAGLNWRARVLPVRVSGKCGALLSDLLDGLRWAAGLPVSGLPTNPNPARVINLSFGGDAPCSFAYQTTIDAVTAAGALIVVAAGNADSTLTRPADCRRVMTVASVHKDGSKAWYSSFGDRVALAAPGGTNEGGAATLLLSADNSGATVPGVDGYGYKQGTSFAAPQAAGVASLMLAVNPSLSPRQLIERMKAGVRPHVPMTGLPVCGTAGVGPCACTTTTCGAGLLDANLSVALATGPAVVIQPLSQVEPGTVITLDGSQSVAIPGAQIVTYQWTQVSGPAATITSSSSAVAQATLRSEGTYVFSLTVVDDASPSRSGEDIVQVVAAMPVVSGGGGGSTGQLWGASLWAWVIAVALWQRRRRSA
ncbi:MAG: S8 family serine peptidase [Hydrogenophaga sp.]|uniref:S8 family serine peptidase n=1 Tax=Hydrogenophaga sp. TaxID=1904254 RepID=UPI004034FC6F